MQAQPVVPDEMLQTSLWKSGIQYCSQRQSLFSWIAVMTDQLGPF